MSTFAAHETLKYYHILASILVSDLDLEDQNCPICMRLYHAERDGANASPEVPVRTTCGHVLGQQCIMRWIDEEKKDTCPLCRTDLFIEHQKSTAAQGNGTFLYFDPPALDTGFSQSPYAGPTDDAAQPPYAYYWEESWYPSIGIAPRHMPFGPIDDALGPVNIPHGRFHSFFGHAIITSEPFRPPMSLEPLERLAWNFERALERQQTQYQYSRNNQNLLPSHFNQISSPYPTHEWTSTMSLDEDFYGFSRPTPTGAHQTVMSATIELNIVTDFKLAAVKGSLQVGLELEDAMAKAEAAFDDLAESHEQWMDEYVEGMENESDEEDDDSD
ncbi:hypothetical protein K469DRAFT_692755 [Zopfia rhizophila CBS 207.26]|uniref:RING-type domain-containing protein n=1 Tax=Zopfia rhizophila CBS 207.26 TaxID=1314779 RepID=A0A6A6DRH6_9PEZI|nr:hypothetical protein K469DRAFT_692755 [Zopfia rhizophila CBS 207.26]